MTLQGQDWSGYQSAAPSTSGLAFAFVKVTEGTGYVNPRWVEQRDHAKANGLVWGGYHYPHMADSPNAEADYFLGQVKWAPGDLIVLDWEGYDDANRGVSKAVQRAYRDAWLAHVKARMPGHRVGMYANLDYWLNVDTTSNCGDFLWIATDGRPAGSPGISYPWRFHQYSTAGGIDHDVANFPTAAALRAWAAGSTPTPTPTEDDMTPAQAQQLAELHDGLLAIGSLIEKDAKGNPVPHGAGYYLAHLQQDAASARAVLAAVQAALASDASADSIVAQIKTLLAGLKLGLTVTEGS